MAFFCFLRVGEITASKQNDPMVHRAIAIQDVRTVDKGNAMLVTLRYSKTDQLGQGTTLKISKLPGITCPVSSLIYYLSMRPKVSGPLLCHLNGKPLTRHQFSAILQKALTAIGPHLRNYKSHSFRLGAATTAAQQGWSIDKIKESGRWASDAYKHYIQHPVIIPKFA